MWIVLWDPFLMKKLLKSKVCGSMNSKICAEKWKKSNFVATVHERETVTVNEQ